MARGNSVDSHQDAFGHCLYDYYCGKEATEIIERDDGFITTSAGPARYLSEYDGWWPEEKRAMDYVQGRVLDIGCGAGRHSLYLQNQGYEVVGVDISPLALKVARLQGLRQTRLLGIADISSDLGIFDTILMLGSNFGLMANPAQTKAVLSTLHKITPPNGRLIAANNDPHQTEDADHLAYHQKNRDKGRMPGQVRIRVRYRKYKDDWFDYLFVSKDEMEELVNDSGWYIRKFIDSDTSRYIAIIDKLG